MKITKLIGARITKLILSVNFRAALHAGYHELQYRMTGNEREHMRAKDQWHTGFGNGRTDHLESYDSEKKK